MKKKPKYMLLILKERNSEYEYYHRSVHQLPDAQLSTMKKCAERWLKGFYAGRAIKEDGGYYFHGGEVFVRIYLYQFIDEGEYNVLRQYLMT